MSLQSRPEPGAQHLAHSERTRTSQLSLSPVGRRTARVVSTSMLRTPMRARGAYPSAKEASLTVTGPTIKVIMRSRRESTLACGPGCTRPACCAFLAGANSYCVRTAVLRCCRRLRDQHMHPSRWRVHGRQQPHCHCGGHWPAGRRTARCYQRPAYCVLGRVSLLIRCHRPNPRKSAHRSVSCSASPNLSLCIRGTAVCLLLTERRSCGREVC